MFFVEETDNHHQHVIALMDIMRLHSRIALSATSFVQPAMKQTVIALLVMAIERILRHVLVHLAIIIPIWQAVLNVMFNALPVQVQPAPAPLAVPTE